MSDDTNNPGKLVMCVGASPSRLGPNQSYYKWPGRFNQVQLPDALITMRLDDMMSQPRVSTRGNVLNR